MKFRLLAALVGTLAAVAPGNAFAGGFEVGSNTSLSNARGGTGVASRTDASATTINPGRLAFGEGFQVIATSNLVDLTVGFKRDPLVRATDVVEYDEATNQAPPFPVPYLALSWDLGLENFAIGLSASGPHAYGRRCLTELSDGECIVDPTNGARMMIVETDIIQIYMLASVSYALELAAGKLGFGLSGGPTFQQNNLAIIIDQASLSVGPPYTENPDSQATFRGVNLKDWKPAFIAGLSWEGNNGLRLGVTYQPGISWAAEGKLELELPPSVADFVELSDDAMTLKTKQAHRLAIGIGHAVGEHPGVEGAPLFDMEFNLVWEDWSRLETFEAAPAGSLIALEQEIPINPVVIPKGYRDTYALRFGTSYGATPWLTLHGGAFMETAAQTAAYTNVDFVSWERYSAGGGFTVHAGSLLDITASYSYIGSPGREVDNGQVYSQVPLSRCTYPNYDQDQCATKGTPPGNPQNNGSWRSHYHIGGLSLGAKF